MKITNFCTIIFLKITISAVLPFTAGFDPVVRYSSGWYVIDLFEVGDPSDSDIKEI